MNSSTIRVKCPADYDMMSSIHSWIYPDIQPVPEFTKDAVFGRVMTIRNKQIPMLITQTKNRIKVDYSQNKIEESDVREKIQSVLGLNIDTSQAIDIITRFPRLNRIIQSLKSIRPYSSDTIFEGLIKTIIQQQISYRAANAITRRMISEISTPTQFNGLELYQFPQPNEIIEFGLDKLKALSLGYKSDRIFSISQMISTGTFTIENINKLSYDELTSLLRPVPGIGEWTIQTLAIAALQDFSVFPYGDLGIQNLLGNLFNDGVRVSRNFVEEFSNSLGESGPMVLYLLMSADVLGWLDESRHPKTPKV
jgi:3-methyladenine DNA glycosylase/8-oxoguanine DNA glycosylase